MSPSTPSAYPSRCTPPSVSISATAEEPASRRHRRTIRRAARTDNMQRWPAPHKSSSSMRWRSSVMMPIGRGSRRCLRRCRSPVSTRRWHVRWRSTAGIAIRTPSVSWSAATVESSATAIWVHHDLYGCSRPRTAMGVIVVAVIVKIRDVS